MSDSYECSYPYDGRHYVGHVVQLAERAIVIENACRSEMSIVMDVMCTIVAIGGCSNANLSLLLLRFRIYPKGSNYAFTSLVWEQRISSLFQIAAKVMLYMINGKAFFEN